MKFNNTRYLWIAVLATAVLAAAVDYAAAFDAHRKGFVLGAGGGFSPLSRFSYGTFSEDGLALAAQFVIGVGWDEQNLLVYEGSLSYRGSDYYSEIGRKTYHFFSGKRFGSQAVLQGFTGPVWYHYYRPKRQTFFSALGVGWYRMTPSELHEDNTGLGILVGGGYSLTRTLQAGIYFMGGETSEGSDAKWKHSQVSLVLSFIKY